MFSMQRRVFESVRPKAVVPRRYFLALGIGLLVVALAALSASIRTEQVLRMVHGATQSSSMLTKTDLTVPMAVDFELVPQPSLLTPRPRTYTRRAARTDVPLPVVQDPWYSVSVRHRPPPRFAA